MTKTEKLLQINKLISEAMEMTFTGDCCISCKEMALMVLNACCPAGYRPKIFTDAIKLIQSI